jgi:hypothetical protein
MLCYLLCYMMNMVSCSKLSFVFLFVHKLLYSNSVLGSILIAQVQIPCVMTFVCKFCFSTRWICILFCWEYFWLPKSGSWEGEV